MSEENTSKPSLLLYSFFVGVGERLATVEDRMVCKSFARGNKIENEES